MSSFSIPLSFWLADYYLAATLLLFVVFVVHKVLKQPAIRNAISWGTTLGLLMLLILVSLPSRPGYSLRDTNFAELISFSTQEIMSEGSLVQSAVEGSRSDTSAKSQELNLSKAIESPEEASSNSRNFSLEKSKQSLSTASEIFRNLALGVFLVGSVGTAIWLFCGFVSVWLLRKRCSEAPEEWTRELAKLSEQSRFAPVLLTNDSIGRALVLGVWRPAIVLPKDFLKNESRSAIHAVLRHEWAHVEHKDLWLGSLIRILLPLLYVHPLFWWFRQQIRADQEYLADELVAAVSSRTEYAEFLVRWAEQYRHLSNPTRGIALGLWESSRLLSRRIELLLDDNRPVDTRIAVFRSRGWVGVFLAVALITSLVTLRPIAAVSVHDSSLTLTENTAIFEGEGFNIAGRVVDLEGNALQGVLVDHCTWALGGTTTTDVEGQFVLEVNTAAKAMQVQFSKKGYSPKMMLNVQSGQREMQIELNSNTYVEGRVVDAKGKGVAGALVRANRGPKKAGGMFVRDLWSETETDVQGNYRLYVEPDRYEFEVNVTGRGLAKNTALVAAGDKLPIDFTLKNEGITFQALILDAITGEPAADVRLWAWQRPDIQGVSDELGRIRIDEVLPSKIRLHMDSEKYARWWFASDSPEEREKRIRANGWRREFDPRKLELIPGMPELKVIVEPGVTISGQVVDPSGQAVEGATVAPVLTGTGNSITGDTRFSVTTDSGGKFEMVLPSSGQAEYHLIAHDGKYRQWRNWANGVGEVLRTQPGERYDDMQIQLTRPATLRGRIVDTEGNGVAGRDVFTRRADGRGHRYFEPATTTANDGSFEIKFVGPGEQMIQQSLFLAPPEQSKKRTTQLVAVEPGSTAAGIELIVQE